MLFSYTLRHIVVFHGKRIGSYQATLLVQRRVASTIGTPHAFIPWQRTTIHSPVTFKATVVALVTWQSCTLLGAVMNCLGDRLMVGRWKPGVAPGGLVAFS